MKKNNCSKGKCSAATPHTNGKGDRARNNTSKQFKNNYDSINWKKKKK